MPVHIAQNKAKLYLGSEKVKKIYRGEVKVYSAGNICTYHVDTSTVYQEEVDEGASCLSPGSFLPEKEGWKFVGWRDDNHAEQDALVYGNSYRGDGTDKIMHDDPFSLYSLFRNEISVKYQANGGTGADVIDKGDKLYNNGNTSSPEFTVKANPFLRSGYTFKNWKKSGENTYYSPNTKLLVPKDIVLLANWIPSTTGNVANDTNYVAKSGDWDASIWYSTGSVTRYASLNLNYQGIYKSALVTFAFNGNNWDEWWNNKRGGSIYINGVEVMSSGWENRPSAYTLTTGGTSIPITIKCHQESGNHSFAGVSLSVSSVTMSV